jgi:hypothetical protein
MVASGPEPFQPVLSLPSRAMLDTLRLGTGPAPQPAERPQLSSSRAY